MSPPAAASSAPTAAKAKKPSFADATASGTGKARKKGDKVVLQSLGSSVSSSRPSASSPPAHTATAVLTSSTAHAPTKAPRAFLATGAAPTKLPRAPISFLPGGDVSSPSPPTQAPPPPPPHAVQSPPSPLPPPPPPAVSYPPQQEPLVAPYQPYNPYPDTSVFNPYASQPPYAPAYPEQNPYNPYDPTLVGVDPPPEPYQPYPIPLLPSSLADFSAPTPIPYPPAIPASPFVGGGYDPEALLRQSVEENGILRDKLAIFAKLHARDKEKLAAQEKEKGRLEQMVEEQGKMTELKATMTAALKQQLAGAQTREEELLKRIEQLKKEREDERRAKESLEKELKKASADGKAREKGEESRLQLEVNGLKREKEWLKEEKSALEKRVEEAEAAVVKLRARDREEGQAEKECERLRKELDIHEAILEIAKTDHLSTSTALRAELSSSLSRLKSEHEADLARLRAEHEATLTAVKHQAAIELEKEKGWVERLSKEQVRDNARAKKEKAELEKELEKLKVAVSWGSNRVKELQDQLAGQGRILAESQQRHREECPARLRDAVEEEKRRGEVRLQQVAAEGRREAMEQNVTMQKKVVELQKEVVGLKEKLTARNQAFSALEEEAATSLDELLAEYEMVQKAKEVLERRVMALEAELEEGRKGAFPLLLLASLLPGMTNFFPPASPRTLQPSTPP